MPYKHTQIGYAIIALMAVAALIMLLTKAFLIAGAIVIIGVLFCSLTVSVGGESIDIAFGPGTIHRRFSLYDVESCQAMKKRCWTWGIHGWPGKWWLYNVSGFHAVELKMKNGMKYYIGTDQPEALEKAINEHRHEVFHRTLKIA